MSKNNPHYLLVDVGEIIQAGDQIRTEYPTSWRKVGTVLIGEPVLGGNVVRRPLRFNPEAAPLMLKEIEIEDTWISNLIADIKAGRALNVTPICENLEARRRALQAAIAAANKAV